MSVLEHSSQDTGEAQYAGYYFGDCDAVPITSLSELEIERELAATASSHTAVGHARPAKVELPAYDECVAQTATELESGGTIRLMKEVLATRRTAYVVPFAARSGMPAHIDIAASSAALAMDALGLSHETESMNDESLRFGVWNYVVPSLAQLREGEIPKFVQIMVYLMLKDSSIQLRGVDCFLYLLGFFRRWECASSKQSRKQSFQYSREQRHRIFPLIVASLFEADVCERLVVAVRDSIKEQPSLHVRLLALQRCFRQLYQRHANIPHFRVANRKMVQDVFKLNVAYWEKQQRQQRHDRRKVKPSA